MYHNTTGFLSEFPATAETQATENFCPATHRQELTGVVELGLLRISQSVSVSDRDSHLFVDSKIFNALIDTRLHKMNSIVGTDN